MPRISFFIFHSKEPVTADSRIWHEPIPLRLDALMKQDGDAESVSHATYFQAAQNFLEANSFETIRHAASRQLNFRTSKKSVFVFKNTVNFITPHESKPLFVRSASPLCLT
jgi:hypothetical protein